MGLSRTLALAAAALVASVAALGAPGAAAPATATPRAALSTLEAGVLQDLNEVRRQHGLVPLRLSPSLTSAAATHSRELGTFGYFDHASRDGTAFWKRIDRWYGQGGYGFWSVGENLLWSSPDIDSAKALERWMRSPEHRKNILTPKWREIGVSAVHRASAPGTYNGLPVTIITTDFGVRR